MKKIPRAEIQKFTKAVWTHYRKQGRHDLAWRKETDPYSIVVSEIMLQQTQVARVEDYYKRWKKAFPNWSVLAHATLSEVLTNWQGLGYNRRGKYLHDISKLITSDYKGRFPKEYKEVLKLPGIGPYTASAVMAFSCNKPAILIETNIRTAVIFHFYKKKKEISETDIEHVLQSCLEVSSKAHKNPREWYWALMDYGSWLKQTEGNLNKRSSTYAKQSRFEGSSRQLRSQILRYILEKESATTRQIQEASAGSRQKEIPALLVVLEKEGIIKKENNQWRIV